MTTIESHEDIAAMVTYLRGEFNDRQIIITVKTEDRTVIGTLLSVDKRSLMIDCDNEITIIGLGQVTAWYCPQDNSLRAATSILEKTAA